MKLTDEECEKSVAELIAEAMKSAGFQMRVKLREGLLDKEDVATDDEPWGERK